MLSLLPRPERDSYLAQLTATKQKAARLETDWSFWGRRDQQIPAGDWRVWLVQSGRGWGKTRTGAETVRQWVRRYPYVNLIGATADDVRQIMVEGESGVMAVCPDVERPQYNPSIRRLDWPNGAQSLLFTADEPERLRGKQSSKIWMDEIAAWRRGSQAWDQAMLGLRLGDNPQALATTTPRPVKLVRDLLAASTTVITRGTTYDNAANLAPAFLQQIITKYEGTRLGRQELLAELLLDTPGALFTRERLDEHRRREGEAPDMARVVVAVDPSGGDGPENDEQGIVVCGKGVDGRGYVLGDRTCKMSPDGWGRRAVKAYLDFSADRIVYEQNFGGQMVESVIKTAAQAMGVEVATKAVHASRGKAVRAEPIAALDEQGRISLVGSHPALEDELCSWTPESGKSPNILDA
ncbi:MAG TPA: terminase family protein, partial [Chloroflexota bacterium]|nr:terminase family protein [Chloroflexota bacterium]